MRAHPLEAFFKRLPLVFLVFIGVVLAAGFILEHVRAQIPTGGGSNSNGSQTVASGTAVMTTAAITAGTCGTTVTVANANIAATDSIVASFASAPNGTQAGLSAWATSGNANFAYCGIAETPAAMTVNWRDIR